MPENTNNMAWALGKIPPEAMGVIMSMLLSALRLVYDRKGTRPIRIILEAALCGCLSLVASSAVLALGMNPQWSIVAGGSIGYLGPATIRTIAVRMINKKLS